MALNLSTLAKINNFLCAFVIETLMVRVCRPLLVIINPTKYDPVGKTNCIKNIFQILFYQIRRRVRLYTNPRLTSLIMKCFQCRKPIFARSGSRSIFSLYFSSNEINVMPYHYHHKVPSVR